MHRLSSQSKDYQEGDVLLVEQPKAPVIVLTSASTDITSLNSTIKSSECKSWNGKLRALTINKLSHQAQIDYYLASTASETQIIVIRLLGGINHWPYGLEQLSRWKSKLKNRKLIVISGTEDNDVELNKLSSIDLNLVKHISDLFRLGGIKNITTFLSILRKLLDNKVINIEDYPVYLYPPILKWDWKPESGYKVGVIFYNSHLKAEDTIYANKIKEILRTNGLSPKCLFVDSLQSKKIQNEIINYYNDEKVEAVITTTAFASCKKEDGEFNKNIWDILSVPVFQFLISTDTEKRWEDSSLGLNPLDLTMQIVMPEIDGRITTRPCAFKESLVNSNNLASPIQKLNPKEDLIDWSVKYVLNWIKLRNIENKEKKITILLANYPIKNGRIANGVGLDTPESLYNILLWLKENRYNLGDKEIPNDSKELINMLLKCRTNDPQSIYKEPLTYLNLDSYYQYWNCLNQESKYTIIKRWGEPEKAIDLEDKGFPIHGIKFGNVAILIQPSRGYDSESLADIHSPDLPPPHRYIAQYTWIQKVFNSNAIIHLGKHGTVEWLPGKGVGISSKCFPHISLLPLPNIYPFIVNDPGEGSQAKRRTQAIIIDHLTPPLGRSELYGNLFRLESLLDEYYDAKLNQSKRKDYLKNDIIEILSKEEFLFSKDLNYDNLTEAELDSLLVKTDSYLCEIKESQIRLGLHILGKIPIKKQFIELATSFARGPQLNHKGITQHIASKLGFKFDPWSEDESNEPISKDKDLLYKITSKIPRKNGEITNYLEKQAKLLIELIENHGNLTEQKLSSEIHPSLIESIESINQDKYLNYLKIDILNKIKISSFREKESLIKSLNGKRVGTGPSGAPTRSNTNVLPTGKNFYSVDIRGLPTQAAWDLGKRSAQQIIEIYNLEKGEELKNIAISIWATSTMRNGGEDISQILALMGIQPIWEYSSRRLIDIEVIPLNILNRPRVDVVTRISGLFRDSFPQLIELLYSAQLKLTNLDENVEMNPYVELSDEGNVIQRIFGSAPGAYGAGLQELISNSNWDNKEQLVESYLNWSKWSYKGHQNPEISINGLKKSLTKVQVVLHNQDNKEHDILDSDDYYQFHGGLSAAVEHYSGKKPITLLADHSRYSRPRLKTLEEEVDKVVRNRLLNPKWIEGIKRHGYKGAFEISASIDYLFGYDATTNCVSGWIYKSLYKTYLIDEENRNFICEENPWALRDIGERLIEASNRGLWKDVDDEILNDIKNIVNKSEGIIENFA